LEQALIKYLPKDKVSLTSDEFKVQEKEGKKNRFYDLLNRAGVDTGVGMDYCQQDEEIYRMVLDAYAEDANERTSFLKDCHDRKDWDNYAVNIHSIKSSSKTIGAVELAELAAELEKASKEKDEETIERGHDRAIELYMDAANAIHKALNSGE
jgi:HPt (histidine-containing phosphotransfer) domain-containing protein